MEEEYDALITNQILHFVPPSSNKNLGVQMGLLCKETF
jgi:hypothetical protein